MHYDDEEIIEDEREEGEEGEEEEEETLEELDIDESGHVRPARRHYWDTVPLEDYDN